MAAGPKPLVFEEYKGPWSGEKTALPAQKVGTTGTGSTTSNVNSKTADPTPTSTTTAPRDATLNKAVVLNQKTSDLMPDALIDVRDFKKQPVKKQITEAPASADDGGIIVKIAAGSEKQEWLNETLKRFEAKKLNSLGGSKPFQVIINYTGSISSGEEIASGNANSITAWSPASSAFRNIVNESYTSGAFDSEDPLAYSPLVYVIYEDTLKKMKDMPKEINMVSVYNIYRNEGQNNAGMFGDPDRMFKFATTNAESNSGLMSLFVASYDFFNNRGQRVQDLNENFLNVKEFQGFLGFLKRRIVSSEASTGRLAARMANVSSMGREFQGALIYENLAVTRTLQKLGTGPNKAHLLYPKYNLLTDHPFYILKQNTTLNQRLAARKFLDFLLSKEIQTLAVEQYGFRPASDEVPASSQAATFKKYLDSGLVQDLQAVTNFIPTPPANTVRMIYNLYKNVDSSQ